MHKEKLSAKITHMLRECIGKLLSAVLLLLIVSLIVYCIVSILPGERSHIIFGDSVGEESYALINSDVPSYVQWLGRVLRLDFGVSSFASQSVSSLIAQRIPLSLTLAFFSLVFAFVFSFFITGMAVKRKKKSAVLIYETVSLVSLSLPSFVISLLLILLFSVKLGLLPSGGFVHFSQNPAAFFTSLILPSLSLGFMHSGLFMRLMKSSLEREMQLSYITLAKAKGLRESAVVIIHAGVNVLNEILTLGFQSFISLFTSGAAVEYIFSLPGIGALTVSAIGRRDINTVTALVLIGAALSIAASTAADIITFSRTRKALG